VRGFGIRHLALAILFVVLATMNSAGYRYGASDQAFYIPVVIRQLDPASFPRDAPLIDAQGRLTFFDNVAAPLVAATHLSLQYLFIALYIITLLVLLAAASRLGRHFYRTRWTAAALAAGLTLRHAIAKTGANTLEGYFHPRQLAFALGLSAVACFLERVDWAWPLLVAGAALLHPTTAAWFAIWLIVAAWVERPAWRSTLHGLGAVTAVAAALVLWRGPLAGHVMRMDAQWLAVISDKDYLFPLAWPWDAWATNLLPVAVIALAWPARRRARLLVDGETGLVAGAFAVLAVFALSLPFNAARIALIIQLQISRIFWLLDIFATLYLVWWLAEGTSLSTPKSQLATPKRAAAVAAVILLFSTVRGIYSCFVEFPDRKIFSVDVAHADWRDAMRWAQSTDRSSGWLADPYHAALYGSSVRAAGTRDVLLEQLKDRAISMYDRGVALSVAERERAMASVAWNTPQGARTLAARYNLDYLVIDRPLDLPLAHRSGSLYIYRIR
jgi:hypothetical protein